MTREEAIKILRGLFVPSPVTIDDNYGCKRNEAISKAIEALQEISILARPKTGKWIIKQGNYCGVMLKEFYCDQCMTRGALRRVFSDPEPLPNYCSNCGADMRGGEHDVD